MSAHMNRVLAEQYTTELRQAANRQRLARDVRRTRTGFAVRLRTALRRTTAHDGRPAGAPQAVAATPADCAPEHA